MAGDHVDVRQLARRVHRAADKLAKWRSFFAGWQLGTRPDDDGECKAVKDHREVTILLRAEVNALTGLLIDKGLFTEVEWSRKLAEELEQLDRDYERRFPGVKSSEQGMVYDPARALETMRALGFPP